MLTTIASPPRLSIRPSRFALRCITTPLSFCNHRSPPLVEPTTEAISSLGIGTREQADVREIVDVPLCLDRGRTEATDAETADRKWIGSPLVEQSAASPAGTADVGRLNLAHIDRAVRQRALKLRVGSGRLLTAPCLDQDGRPEQRRPRERRTRSLRHIFLLPQS